MTTKEQGMDIFQHGTNVWTIQTTDDSIMIIVLDGVPYFYRPAEDIADIS